MLLQKKEIIESHIKTHTERSADDVAAVSTVEYFLRTGGRIITNFSRNDKWPNIDGTFEFVSNPEFDRRPRHNFFVQIKGTNNYSESDSAIKYSLKSLAFPAFIASDKTLDPGILFVVLNPNDRGKERLFFKYMSVEFINSINFEHDSATINFTAEEEILNTDESLMQFCAKLETIVLQHSFVNKLSEKELNRDDIEKIIIACDKHITSKIELIESDGLSRAEVSNLILPRLYDLCRATLLMNSLKLGNIKTNLQLAWEQAQLNIETKYLSVFMKGLKYIEDKEADEDQSDRLMLKYYDFLWQIRDFLRNNYNINILHNLEKFPLNFDKQDEQYYKSVAHVFNSVKATTKELGESRFYIQKKTPFFIGEERYYEVTLQLAGIYATKYNRITAYTKENISTGYSIKIHYENCGIKLFGIDSNIKIITDWEVSVEPKCLNLIGKIIGIPTTLSARYNEYKDLMRFFTESGINLLELIDLNDEIFYSEINRIYAKIRNAEYKEVLIKLKQKYSKESQEYGKHVIRYLLLKLKEETIENVLPYSSMAKRLCKDLYVAKGCRPFEDSPFLSNLRGSKTANFNNLESIIDITNNDKINEVIPYIKIKKEIARTGEIYFDKKLIATDSAISNFNNSLDSWEKDQGYQIISIDEFVTIDSYETITISILSRLMEFTKEGNKGQKEYNTNYIKENKIIFEDKQKMFALKNAFVNSKIMLIYGAAGTGKTTLINYVSSMMSNHKKLFLTKTHAAKQNLKRRIDNPGVGADFISLDSFTKRVELPDYDIIFVDECSTIDNRIMLEFLKKVKNDTLLVFAGDVYQIESIEFGNWFLYAKELIKKEGSNIELLNTWRTQEQDLIGLWDEVRKCGDLMIEKLAIDGPFSREIGEDIFASQDDDMVVLCLNYDGKFGLNSINNYFQCVNRKSEAVVWQDWSYKVGDPILFNDSKRFTVLYNNLKGRIAAIEIIDKKIWFTIDIAINVTEDICKKDGIEWISASDGQTRIRFFVASYNENAGEKDEDFRVFTVIPFELAYAVSIHKAQGLEYESVKVVIPESNTEKITHGVFYTAITRAKKKLKIYWNSNTMKKVVANFDSPNLKQKSLDILKKKLNFS